MEPINKVVGEIKPVVQNQDFNSAADTSTKPATNITRLRPLILIIEDESLISNMYSHKLSTDGYDVLNANNGNEGVKLAKENIPDLILCDIMMPDKDGLSTLKDLKSDESTKNIPVIMLSNLADDKYVMQALDMGAVSYLVKSNVLPPDVVIKVKEVLKGAGKESLLTKAA